MPSLTLDFLLQLKDNFKKYTNFIETGTHYGGTISVMQSLFVRNYTIEIQPHIFELVNSRYSKENTDFLLGDSSTILASLLPNICGKSLIFLDGHFSYGDTGRGTKDCPLLEEVSCINLFHANSAIIIIDDARLFGTGSWQEILADTILEIVKERCEQFYFLPSELHEQDRLVIHLVPNDSRTPI